jgi:glucans biosynthesis protein
VELIEIPTAEDIHDNIVAFWVPDQQPEPGQPFAFAYGLTWFGEDHSKPPGGRVVATRRDGGTHDDAHRFVIDFEGSKLAALPADTVLRGVVSATTPGGESAELLEQAVIHNPVTQGWRLVFQIRPSGGDPLELRAFLQHDDDTLTETWAYLLKP